MITNIKERLVRVSRQITGLLPTELPQGQTAWNQYIDTLIETYDLPTTKRSDVEYVVANQVLGTGPTGVRMSMYRMALAVRAGGAKQLAAAAFQRIQQAHREEVEALQQKASENTEATDKAETAPGESDESQRA